ncbi:MAG: energy-coupling factor transporter ATPase [Bacillota bacterium]|nr:energy-coupling factor transporter ATPase [Bacillota bacterium]
MAVRIELEGVGHTYFPGTPHEVRALEGLDLVIEKGECIGVIGPTGSGKSTLAQCLNGLLKPTHGRIVIDGQDIAAVGRGGLKGLRRRVGLVFQFPEHQLFDETVLQDVAFGPRNLGLTAAEALARARRALDAVGMGGEQLAERSPFALSGGQMRRVAIAGVLAMEPEALVLDEPAAGLDPRGREDILGRVRSLHRERGLTVVVISHNMDEVARLADRLLVLADGKPVMLGATAEVFGRGEELRRLGLDVPVTVRVLDSLRALGWDLPSAAAGIDHAASAIAAALGAKAGDGTC